jgi:hypothetical protein
MKLAGICVLLALAAVGCVKQETIRTRGVPDIYRLCNDQRFDAMCTESQPLQVDTNLASPPPARPILAA